jgi:excisionase family DNA binding protein
MIMAKVGVKRATELTGVSKSTIQRAMNDGKLSFERKGKNRVIDVSELERVYGINETKQDTDALEAHTYEIELEKARHALAIDRLEMKVKIVEDKLDMAEDQINDLKAQRDQWQKQAQQVLLTSQTTQKQADDRISELQKREESRTRAIQAKRQQELQRQKSLQASNQNKTNHSLFSALFTKKKKAS